MTDLIDQLRPASFRGVPFCVRAADFSAGRRSQLSEYPQKDKPYVDDMGRSTREIRVAAFLTGVDYIAQARRLVTALETAGPGTLVHPWFGAMQVSLADKGVVRFTEALGEAAVDLSFIESGELDFPAAGKDTPAQSRTAAGLIEQAAQGSFADVFSVAGMPQYVLDAANGNIASALQAVAGVSSLPGLSGPLGVLSGASSLGSLLGYAQGLTGAIASAQGLLGNPLGLAQSIGGFLGLSGPLSAGSLVFGSGLQLLGVVNGLIGLVSSPALQDPAPFTPFSTPQSVRLGSNTAAINALVRQSVLAQAVGLSGDLEITVYQDAVAVRQALAAALDTEAATAPDAAYTAMQDARSKVWADITERARDSARLVNYTPPAVFSALAIAYDRYEDANRDLEVVARNKIPRPGFVPVRPLQLLSR